MKKTHTSTVTHFGHIPKKILHPFVIAFLLIKAQFKSSLVQKAFWAAQLQFEYNTASKSLIPGVQSYQSQYFPQLLPIMNILFCQHSFISHLWVFPWWPSLFIGSYSRDKKHMDRLILLQPIQNQVCHSQLNVQVRFCLFSLLSGPEYLGTIIIIILILIMINVMFMALYFHTSSFR